MQFLTAPVSTGCPHTSSANSLTALAMPPESCLCKETWRCMKKHLTCASMACGQSPIPGHPDLRCSSCSGPSQDNLPGHRCQRCSMPADPPACVAASQTRAVPRWHFWKHEVHHKSQPGKWFSNKLFSILPRLTQMMALLAFIHSPSLFAAFNFTRAFCLQRLDTPGGKLQGFWGAASTRFGAR